MTSLSPDEERAEFKAARKQAADARAWKYNKQYEDDLAAIKRDPAIQLTLSADHRSMLGYYKSARDAAVAEGIKIQPTGGNQR